MENIKNFEDLEEIKKSFESPKAFLNLLRYHGFHISLDGGRYDEDEEKEAALEIYAKFRLLFLFYLESANKK